MKKFFPLFAMILAAAMLTASFSAAGNDSYSVYANAMKKLNAAKSIETELDAKISQIFPSDSYDQQYDYRAAISLKQIVNADKKLELEARMINAEDNTPVMDMYYKGGRMYQFITEAEPVIKTKTKMNEQKAVITAYGLDRTLSAEDFKSAKIKKTNDGYVINCKVSGKGFSGMLDNGFFVVYKDLGHKSEITASDITYTMSIGSDGALKAYKISVITQITVKNDPTLNVKIKYDITGKIKALNKIEKINYPKYITSCVETELF